MKKSAFYFIILPLLMAACESTEPAPVQVEREPSNWIVTNVAVGNLSVKDPSGALLQNTDGEQVNLFNGQASLDFKVAIGDKKITRFVLKQNKNKFNFKAVDQEDVYKPSLSISSSDSGQSLKFDYRFSEMLINTETKTLIEGCTISLGTCTSYKGDCKKTCESRKGDCRVVCYGDDSTSCYSSCDSDFESCSVKCETLQDCTSGSTGHRNATYQVDTYKNTIQVTLINSGGESVATFEGEGTAQKSKLIKASTCTK